MRDAINFDSHIPYYIQLMDILRDKMQQKEWAPSDQIPGEKEYGEPVEYYHALHRGDHS